MTSEFDRLFEETLEVSVPLPAPVEKKKRQVEIEELAGTLYSVAYADSRAERR